MEIFLLMPYNYIEKKSCSKYLTFTADNSFKIKNKLHLI